MPHHGSAALRRIRRPKGRVPESQPGPFGPTHFQCGATTLRFPRNLPPGTPAASRPSSSRGGAGVSARAQPKEMHHEVDQPMVGGMTARTAVLDRIAGLPVKVAAPLRELVRSELMSERTAETLLDAGELTGQPQHLLGFAAALDELRRKGVPIEDAVRMARQQGRRISLRWSPKRWRAEHDRMSRRATLDRLTATNAVYELSEYERHLPERWPGYLIRTSRRLGLEGLRQGHCVASYHDIVTAGRQAIAAVFVDRKRWTVALVRTGAEDAPLRITQIRGPHNRSPAASDTAAIHERLGIEPPRRQAATAQPPRTGAYLENLRRALPALGEHGITYVYVAFSGEGDSGQIDDVYFTPSPPPGERYEFTVPCEAARHFREGNRWRTVRALEDTPIEEAIRALTDEYLEEFDVDWYNNDGGQGHLEIDVGAGTAGLAIATNYTERTTQVCRTVDIATGVITGDDFA